jgi:hypothetical protein
MNLPIKYTDHVQLALGAFANADQGQDIGVVELRKHGRFAVEVVVWVCRTSRVEDLLCGYFRASVFAFENLTAAWAC